MKRNKRIPKPRKTTIAALERLYNALLSRLDALELAFDIAQRTQEAKGKKAKQLCRDLEKASQAVRAFSNAAFDKDGKAFVHKGTQTGRVSTGKGLLPVLVDDTSYSGKECDASLCSNTAIAVGDVVEALDTAGTPLEKGARYNVLQLMSTKLLLLEDVRTKKQCGTYQLDHLKLVERKADKPNEQAEEIGTARQEWLNKGDEASLEEMYKKRFPIGSLVKCVRGSNDFDDDIDVKAGLIYTVEGHVVFGQSGKQWLELKLAGNPCSWSTDRFKPVKSAKFKKSKPVKTQFKAGDKVEFRKPNPPEQLDAPIHVVNVRVEGLNKSLTVEDANGFRSAGWSPNWFKLVEPAKPKKGNG